VEFRTTDTRHSEADAEIRILDTSAMKMAAGNLGNVIAAPMDKFERVCLILAKNAMRTRGASVSALTNCATVQGISLP
jgi:hypothetical protein